jgi:rubrerythrin
MKTQENVKHLQSEIVDAMKKWQKVEDASLASTGRIIEKTTNPIIRLTMEIIQRDSQMHYNVEKWVAESLQDATISLTPEELTSVWTMIERHIELEHKMIDLVEKLLPSLKGKGMVVQEYLLNYLLEDETTHANLLKRLAGIKRGMLP